MRYLIIVIIFLVAQAGAHAAVNDFSAVYEVYQNGFYLGKSHRKLTTQNNDVTFTAVTESGGIAAWFFEVKITETSKLKLKDNHLTISSYSYDEKQNDKHDFIELKIDNTKQLYNSYNKEHYPLTQNLYDGLGFSIAMMHDLKNGLRELNYTIAEKEHLKPYHLKFLGLEKLRASNQDITTLKIEYFDPASKTRFTFWCVENMDFLPIRIRNIKSNGDEIVLNLTEFNQKPVYLELESDNDNN